MALKRPLDTIGASDIATLIWWRDVLDGKAPPFQLYSGSGIVELYRRIVTGEPRDDDNSTMSGGKASEPLLVDIARELYDRPIDYWDEPVQHGSEAKWWCTPDCKIDGGWGLEIKSVYDHRRECEWGKDGSDRHDAIPAQYYWQLQWSMIVCGVSEWEMVVRLATGYNACADMDIVWAAYHDGLPVMQVIDDCRDVEIRSYTVKANEEHQDHIQSLVRHFLEFYVDIRQVPEPVGLDADTRALRDLADDDGGIRLPQDEEERDIIDEMYEKHEWAKEYDQEYQDCKQRLWAIAQNTDASGIVDEQGRGAYLDSRGSFRIK